MNRLLDVRGILAQMGTVRRGGLDPRDVAAALKAAADELRDAWRERDQALAEAQRHKDALRQWQSEHAKTRQAPPAPDATAVPRPDRQVDPRLPETAVPRDSRGVPGAPRCPAPPM